MTDPNGPKNGEDKLGTEQAAAILVEKASINCAPASSSSVSLSFLLLYPALCLLFAVQLLAILRNHSHIGGPTMFDTILLLIVKADMRWPPLSWLIGRQQPHTSKISNCDLRPLLLVIGGTVFQALLFVNLSHALEAITCADSSSHFSPPFICMVVLNLVAKSPLIFCSDRLSLADLSLANRWLLHFGPSLAALGLFMANWHFTPEDDFLISHMDRYLGAGFCLLLSVAIFPISWNNLPFLLCDSPPDLDCEELKAQIERQLPQIRCRHLHIYRKWPGQRSFDVFAHVQLELLEESGQDEAEEKWTAERQVSAQLAEMHAFLRQMGARQVSIEPLVSGANGGASEEEKAEEQQRWGWRRRGAPWPLCIGKSCQSEEKFCCTPNGTAEH